MKNRVVIGTWPLSGDFGRVPLKQVAETLEACWDFGFREFDTAPNYGNGFIEFCLGKSFSGRSGLLINTKCGNLPFGGKNFEVAHLTRSLEESLKRTGVDCFNVLFLHNPRTEIKDYNPLIKWFEKLKTDGKILKSGISLAKGFDYLPELIKHFDVVQDDINLLYLDPLFRNLPTETLLMARSPLASGLLGGQISQSKTFDPGDHRSSWVKGERLTSILKRIDRLKKEVDMPISQLARRYLFSQQRIGKIIFGVKRREHIFEIVEDLERPQLSSDTISKINHLFKTDFGLTNEKHLSY